VHAHTSDIIREPKTVVKSSSIPNGFSEFDEKILSFDFLAGVSLTHPREQNMQHLIVVTVHTGTSTHTLKMALSDGEPLFKCIQQARSRFDLEGSYSLVYLKRFQLDQFRDVMYLPLYFSLDMVLDHIEVYTLMFQGKTLQRNVCKFLPGSTGTDLVKMLRRTLSLGTTTKPQYILIDLKQKKFMHPTKELMDRTEVFMMPIEVIKSLILHQKSSLLKIRT
jgi:hypothetical protein